MLFLFLSPIIGQDYFNRMIGDRVGALSARSMALGGVGLMSNNTSSAAVFNPAAMMRGQGLKFDLSWRNNALSEYRSFPAVNTFDDIYADLTYAVNYEANDFNHLGFTFIKDVIGFSMSTGQFISTEYNYNEEVRSASDEFSGYFQFNTSGMLSCNSLAFGLSPTTNFHLGLSFNQIPKSNLKAYRDSLGVVNYNLTSGKTSKGTFAAVSLWWKLSPGLEFSISFEDKSKIQYSDSLSILFDNSLGLPIYEFTNHSSAHILLKPAYARIGFSHKPSQLSQHEVIIEYEKASYETQIDSTQLRDSHTLGIGVDYNVINFAPLRMGFTFTTSPFRKDLSKTIYSIGTGWNFKNLQFDIGMRYWDISYPYYDIFPVQGDLSNPFYTDFVNEKHFDMILSFGYSF